MLVIFFFFFQAEDGIRDGRVTGVQTCALPIWSRVYQKTVACPSRLEDIQVLFRVIIKPVNRYRRIVNVKMTILDRKSTRLNSSHPSISYAVFCLKKKKETYSLEWTMYYSNKPK